MELELDLEATGSDAGAMRASGERYCPCLAISEQEAENAQRIVPLAGSIEHIVRSRSPTDGESVSILKANKLFLDVKVGSDKIQGDQPGSTRDIAEETDQELKEERPESAQHQGTATKIDDAGVITEEA